MGWNGKLGESSTNRDERRDAIFARIEETTRTLIAEEREFAKAKAVLDARKAILEAAKDSRADAVTELFDLLKEEVL